MGDEIYQSNGGALIELVYDLSEPEYKKKFLGLDGVLQRASDDTVFLLDNLSSSALRIAGFVNEDEVNLPLVRAEASQLREFADEVREEVMSAFFARVQDYRRDIEKLREAVESEPFSPGTRRGG